MVCENDLVVTEHVEQWRFHTGEIIDHPFTSVMEITDGLIFVGMIIRILVLLDQAPQWWLDHIIVGWRDNPEL